MKQLLNDLFQHETLSREEAKEVLIRIGNGEVNNAQMAAFLTLYRMRSLKVEELEGFRDAMLELCVKVDLSDYNGIDIVGTGGDEKNTFNISTVSSLVVAGAGYHVTKHGNYGASSVSGSSNVLEHLGVKFSNKEEDLKRDLDKAGFCMMHAPLFHPAMKYIGPIRRELGIRTFFNIIGPLVNPSFPKNFSLGTFNLDVLRLYGYLFQNTEANFSISHSLDGYDEISLTGAVKIMGSRGDMQLEPKDFGFEKVTLEEISGGDSIASAAKTFVNILEDKATKAQKSVVLANAGLAIYTADNKLSLKDAVAKAKEAIESGKAKEVLKKLVD